jgi:arylsulfatase
MQLDRVREARAVMLLLLLPAISSGCRSLSAGRPQRPPNIVLILTDDQGWHDLGCYGSETIVTPCLDRMAAEGMRFTHFYAQAVCGPSRAALMTGCYPIRLAEPGNRKGQHTVLHPKEITIAEQLRSAGYRTALIGKWHLGGPMTDQNFDRKYDPTLAPNAQGFDEFYGTPVFNGLTVFVEDTDKRWPLMRNTELVERAVQSWDHITRDYTGEALRFVRDNADRPFFLMLSHNMPHIPLGASEDFKGQSEYGPYGDAIEEIDHSTGRILDELERLGIDDDTIVLFTSDNGPWIETTHGNDPARAPFIPPEHSGSTGDLRGYKMLTWDGGSRVPFIAWAPGRIPEGRVCDELACTLDFFPTFSGWAGAPLPEDRTLDGHDLRDVLEEESLSPRCEYFYYCYTHLQAVRCGRWKLVRPRPEHPEWVGWSGRFVGQAVEAVELYDLVADPGETRDVAAANPSVVDRLLALVEEGRRELGDYDRIGAGARFFDEGERRPDVKRWEVAAD